MKLADLLKSRYDVTIPIKDASGSDTGHHVLCRHPHSNEAVAAIQNYSLALARFDDQFKIRHADIAAKAEAESNFAEYNIAHGIEVAGLKDAYIAEIVTGWSFDCEYSSSELLKVMKEFRYPVELGLADQILTGYQEAIGNLQKKS